MKFASSDAFDCMESLHSKLTKETELYRKSFLGAYQVLTRILTV